MQTHCVRVEKKSQCCIYYILVNYVFILLVVCWLKWPRVGRFFFLLEHFWGKGEKNLTALGSLFALLKCIWEIKIDEGFGWPVWLAGRGQHCSVWRAGFRIVEEVKTATLKTHRQWFILTVVVTLEVKTAINTATLQINSQSRLYRRSTFSITWNRTCSGIVLIQFISPLWLVLFCFNSVPKHVEDKTVRSRV